MNIPDGTPTDDIPIWRIYKGRCVIHPSRPAVCLHEEPPKSLNPFWHEMPETRFALCNECHEMVHRMTRLQAREVLMDARDLNVPGALNALLILKKNPAMI